MAIYNFPPQAKRPLSEKMEKTADSYISTEVEDVAPQWSETVDSSMQNIPSNDGVLLPATAATETTTAVPHTPLQTVIPDEGNPYDRSATPESEEEEKPLLEHELSIFSTSSESSETPLLKEVFRNSGKKNICKFKFEKLH